MKLQPTKRNVLIAIGVACLAVFIAGMGAAWVNRHHAICSDGKSPVEQRGALLGQVAVRCHNGQVVTLNN
ncbi:MAG: hypothetical protein WAU41_16790 [Gaiellaceae bacterium]